MGVRAAPARRAPISPSHAHLRKAQMICALVVRSGARATGVRVCVVCGGGGGGVQRLLGSWLAFSFCARVLGCVAATVQTFRTLSPAGMHPTGSTKSTAFARH